jgi:hypothetical protein
VRMLTSLPAVITTATAARNRFVRAVYANGGTGNFTICYDVMTLYVHHGSLGNLGAGKNLPLVVNLPFTPTEVYAWFSSAK